MRRILFILSICITSINAFPSAYWAFDETSDTLLVDSSGNGNTAFSKSPIRVGGVVKGALKFDGSGMYAYAGNSASLNFTDQFSVECWINIRHVLALNQTIIEKLNCYLFGVGDGGRISFFVEPGKWTGAYTFTEQSIEAMCWNHLAGVWDGEVMKVFVNGVEDANTMPAGGTNGTNSNNVYIGQFFEMNRGGRLKGKLDELKLYDYALSPDTIAAHCDKEAWRRPSPVRYPLNTFDRRPLLQWHPMASGTTYRVQVAVNDTFAPVLTAVTTQDTFFMPAKDLPVARVYWRVSESTDTSEMPLVSSFTILDSSAIKVPDQVPTVTEALEYGSHIIITSEITEDITIVGRTVTIHGSDTLVAINGKTTVRNSTVAFRNIEFRGASGGCDDNTCAVLVTSCDGAPAATGGKVGNTGLMSKNSEITLNRCVVRGGQGGPGQTVIAGGLMDGIICSNGKCGDGGIGCYAVGSKLHIIASNFFAGPPGSTECSNGFALNAEENTVIDTMQVMIEMLNIDSTCSIIPGTTGVTPEYKMAAYPNIMVRNGTIIFDGPTEYDVKIITMSGRMIYRNNSPGTVCRVPNMNGGVYIVVLSTGKQKRCIRIMNIR